EPFDVEIAAHWQGAREPRQALVWYRRAAKTAQRSLMLRQAVAANERAVELMEGLLGLDGAPEKGPLQEPSTWPDGVGFGWGDYLSTLVAVGDLYEGFGEFEAAEKSYRGVVRCIGQETGRLNTDLLEVLAQSWLGLGHIAWQRGDFEGAEWAFARVRDLIKGLPELGEFDEDAARGRARVAWHRGDYEQAQELARQAHEASAARGDDGGQAESLWIFGEVARMLGQGEKARQFYDQSLELYNNVNIPTGIARNFLSMAQLARYQKSFREAENLYRRALTRYETLGDRRGGGQCFNGLGDVARFRGLYSEARVHYDRALELYQAMGAEYDVAVVYANLGLTAIALGELGAARLHLTAGRALIAQKDYPYLVAGVEYNLALTDALAGEERESSATVARVLELAERFPIPDLDYAQPLERLAELRAEAGNATEAIALWRKARDIYGELDLTEDQGRIAGKIEDASKTPVS
ncbi:MAG: tetratricopeptide repeat protein, partial [Bradymonadaceae bacterium]